MGRIHDALKRAEREAEVIRKKKHPSDLQRESLIEEAPGGATSSLYEQKKPLPFSSQLLPGTTNLFVLQDTHSFIAEQYKILRTRLQSFGKEKGIKTILVTSCLPQEGKSTVSLNLSVCIAHSINEHALLIDCDLRRPVIHAVFHLPEREGLSRYLSADIPLSSVLHKTEVKKLTVLPAGSPPSNPSELLSSKKMVDLIQEVRSRYQDRYVVFDSAPVHQTPDPTILAKHVDGILLVVREGKTHREIVARTADLLGREKILGVVFNMVREPIKSYYYKYNYYYPRH